MDWCLVGDWVGTISTSLNLEKVGTEMKQAWRLNGGLANLGEKKLLLEFDSKREATRVLQKDKRKFSYFRINLRQWKPDEGCSSNPKTPKKVWVRLFGLPIFLWEEKNLKRLGDACGGFITADKHTRTFSELQWARILVRGDGEKFPQVLFFKMEETSWKIQLWWEFPPISTTLMARVSAFPSKDGHREEDEGNKHANKRMAEGLVVLTVEQLKQVQEGGSIDEELTSNGVLIFGSHTPLDAYQFLNSGGTGTLGSDLSDLPQVANGLGPFWEELVLGPKAWSSPPDLGPKAGSSTAPLDLDPYVSKPTFHESSLGFCLDLEIDRYENSSSPSTPFVFSQTPPLEEFVYRGGGRAQASRGP